jgi:putative oxidoreductase
MESYTMEISLGLAVLRVVVGLLLAGHGAQKLFGWFGGHGFAGTVGFLQAKGFKPAALWALLGTLGEFVGGLLLALGFLSPLGSIAIFASMLMAVLKFHWKQGLWSMQNGYEYPLVLGVVGLFFGWVGVGGYSLDALLGIALPGVLFEIGVVAAIIVDLIGLFTSRQPAQQHQTAEAA